MPTGDLNNDGIVDAIDLSIFVSRWGSSDPDADLNNDGIVDAADLSLLVGNWGAETELDPPVASFVVSPENPVAGQEITFDATSSERAVSWQWEEVTPPGGWSFGQDVDSEIYAFVFQNSGIKQVQLTVADELGRTDSITIPVEVLEPDDPSDPDDPDSIIISHGSELLAEHTGLAAWGIDPATLIASGAFASSYDGQIIEDYDFTRSSTGTTVSITHQNVVVRKCRVNHLNGANGIVTSSGGSATVEYCDFNGGYREEPTGNFASIGIRGSNITSRRNYFYGGRDGIHALSNHHAYENYVHDLHQHSGAHNDGIHTTGGYTNTLVERNNVPAGNSGGVTSYSFNGPVRDLSIFDNLIRGVGRGFGIYGGAVGASDPSLASYHCGIENIRIEGNRFTGNFRWPETVGEGTNAAVNTARPGCTFIDNRWLNDDPHGSELPPRCGAQQDACEPCP